LFDPVSSRQIRLKGCHSSRAQGTDLRFFLACGGQIHTISSDPNISRLQGYTINLYKEIEKVSDDSIISDIPPSSLPGTLEFGHALGTQLELTP
jgi:hypothetical protein